MPGVTLEAFPDHDGLCDHDNGHCGKQARLAKLAAAQPAGAGQGGLGWNANAPAASVALYCSREHADQQPTATYEAAETTFASLPPIGSGARLQAWRELLGAWPEPLDIIRVLDARELSCQWLQHVQLADGGQYDPRPTFFGAPVVGYQDELDRRGWVHVLTCDLDDHHGQ
jgi:hypothetical protein